MSVDKDIKFWQTDIGKKMMHGMHDHSNGICSMRTTITSWELKLEKDNFTKEDLKSSLKSLKLAVDRCKDSADYMYTSIKEYKMSDND